jgi:hypothetical protein
VNVPDEKPPGVGDAHRSIADTAAAQLLRSSLRALGQPVPGWVSEVAGPEDEDDEGAHPQSELHTWSDWADIEGAPSEDMAHALGRLSEVALAEPPENLVVDYQLVGARAQVRADGPTVPRQWWLYPRLWRHPWINHRAARKVTFKWRMVREWERPTPVTINLDEPPMPPPRSGAEHIDLTGSSERSKRS